MNEKYSIWNDVDMYRMGTIDTSKEAIPTNSVFATRQGEVREFEPRNETLSFNAMLQNLENGTITQLDKKILCILGTSRYATIKQISELLILIGETHFNDNMLTSSIKRLYKNGLICISRIVDPNGNKTSKIISLDKNGSEIAKQLGVNYVWSAFERVDEPWKLKSILCSNQLRNAYLKSGLPLQWFKLRVNLTIQGCIVKPAFATEISNVVFLFEVVRNRTLWQNSFAEKMSRYYSILKSIDEGEKNSWNITSTPYIVINGESFEHNLEIYNLLLSLNLDFGESLLFTEDLLQFGEKFKRSLYTIKDANGTAEYLQFDM